jgi:cytochrome c553
MRRAMPALPTEYDAERARFDRALDEIDDALNLHEASVGLARLGGSCADCHARAGASMELPPEPLPPGDGVRAEMLRHQFAMERLWIGIVGRSPALLHDGADAFAASDLAPIGAPAEAGAMALDQRVHESAARVADAPDDGAREQAFADLVGACVACHVANPGGIAIEPE